VSKQERKSLCRLIDSRKLTSHTRSLTSCSSKHTVACSESCYSSSLYSEQTKLNRHIDWSRRASFSSLRSPSGYDGVFDQPARCLSKRKMNTQQMEIKKTEGRCLQTTKSVQCHASKHRWKRWAEKKKGFFNNMNLNLNFDLEGKTHQQTWCNQYAINLQSSTS
jgi:hypothetical protein